MEIGDVLRELIFQQISKDVLRKVAVELGMQTLRQGAVDKSNAGALDRRGGLPGRLDVSPARAAA